MSLIRTDSFTQQYFEIGTNFLPIAPVAGTIGRAIVEWDFIIDVFCQDCTGGNIDWTFTVSEVAGGLTKSFSTPTYGTFSTSGKRKLPEVTHPYFEQGIDTRANLTWESTQPVVFDNLYMREGNVKLSYFETPIASTILLFALGMAAMMKRMRI